MSTIKVKTEDGISTYRVFKETRLVDTQDVNHVNPIVKEGYIEVKYGQYKVIDISDKVIPETVINRCYYVKDNPDILAPDGSVLLPSKLRFTTWCNYITPYPLQAFFRAVINDTLESYPDLNDNAIIPDYSNAEIQTALDDWNNTHS
jgi:hypothetical protein